MNRRLRHLIECHCILPQYRGHSDAVYHKFVVFTEIDGDDNVIVKHAQCNNCGVIHRIIDVGRSEIIPGKEASASLVNVSDVKLSLPQSVVSVLETYACDVSVWEEAAWIIEHSDWGSCVILSSEEKSGVVEGKYLKFIGHSSVKIEPFSNKFLFPAR